MAEHRPARLESLQPYTERSSRPGSEPPSVEADVYVWHYELPVVHARKAYDMLARYMLWPCVGLSQVREVSIIEAGQTELLTQSLPSTFRNKGTSL